MRTQHQQPNTQTESSSLVTTDEARAQTDLSDQSDWFMECQPCPLYAYSYKSRTAAVCSGSVLSLHVMEKPTLAVTDASNSVLVFASNISSTPPATMMIAASSVSVPLQEEYLFVAVQETNYNNELSILCS